MNTPIRAIAAPAGRFGLIPRLIVIGAVLAAEILVGSYLVQATPLDTLAGGPQMLRLVQHWLFRFLIAYGVSLSILAYLRRERFASVLHTADQAPFRPAWALVHALLVVPFLYLSAALYTPSAPFAAMALAWHVTAVAASLALFAAMAPLSAWAGVLRQSAGLPLFAIVPAAAAVAAIKLSQMLWEPAAELTFRLVRLLLEPALPRLQSDSASLTLITDHFAVQIAEVCSGLEGIGLMLTFCTAWLWFFRREYYFPRALLVIPVGVIVVFLLNAVRIATLVLIGDAGYERVATVGFHSQAGWIAFNLAAFGVAILAHTSPWVSRAAAQARTRRREAASSSGTPALEAASSNPTAAYLMPLLALLAAGMIAHALSDGFELLYALRPAAALTALWLYRKSYPRALLRCSWRGALAGVVVFGLWLALAKVLTAPHGEPEALAALSAPLRIAWLGCRATAAVAVLPIAEELAYRGYLLRRLGGSDFEQTPFSAARWPALALSALAFGLMQGRLWAPGTIAGLGYGLLAKRTGKLGESICAHATANALIAACVLGDGQWQLW
ncbi:MAG TPA: exosortase E/protease, VPEID-CTERM system [Steroidobacteraceae bacterium]|nr:exosortase E/protease, VPEID-CTERM system [Steroidobacteraceae bacterium]